MRVECENPACDEFVERHQYVCESCGTIHPYPHIRAARNDADALASRYHTAQAESSGRQIEAEVADLEALIDGATAVSTMMPHDLDRMLSGGERIFRNHRRRLESGNIMLASASEELFHDLRNALDQAIWPDYADKLFFASLSADGRGAWGFGPFAVAWKAEKLPRRAAVFEDNSLNLALEHKAVSPRMLPKGVRSTWKARVQLGLAKLIADIVSGASQEVLVELILPDTMDPWTTMLEVQIWGGMAVPEIASIRFVREYALAGEPAYVSDARLEEVEELCVDHGISLEEWPR